MTNGQIKEAIEKEDIVLENFSEDYLEPSSYDMRLGKRALVSNREEEIRVDREGSLSIGAGEFCLLTTYENVGLSETVGGQIGMKSEWSRKGLVGLHGLQIDPGFEGVLVIGAYNASPRTITLDYKDPFLTVEFHRLSEPVQEKYEPGREQRRGRIPDVDKSYLRTVETESLSEMSESIRQLSQSVNNLNKVVYRFVLPIITATFVAALAGLVF